MVNKHHSILFELAASVNIVSERERERKNIENIDANWICYTILVKTHSSSDSGS